MLARSKRISDKVRARAEIVSQPSAADAHAIDVLRLRICDLKIGKDRVRSDIRKLEFLFPPVLAAQLDLPDFRRHIIGFVKPRKLFGLPPTRREFTFLGVANNHGVRFLSFHQWAGKGRVASSFLLVIGWHTANIRQSWILVQVAGTTPRKKYSRLRGIQDL